MGQVIKNLGWGGDVLDARLGSASGADSNDPKFLDWDGENYVYLPGVTGNFLSVPDEAVGASDFDVRVLVAQDSWTSGSQALMAKDDGSSQRGFIFANTSGTLRLYWSVDGSTWVTAIASTALSGVTDGQPVWLRATRAVATGIVYFYKSFDALTWSQIGTSISTGTSGAMYNNNQFFSVGHYSSTGWPATGKFYRAQVLNGINGTPVLDVDCSQITSGSDTSFTALTGQTVTINRSTSGRKSVAVVSPVWLFGTDDYLEVADNDLLDFGASDSFTVLAVVRQWATAGFTALVSKGDADASPMTGWFLSSNAAIANMKLGDGSSSAYHSSVSQPYANLGVVSMTVNRSTGTAQTTVNGASGTAPAITYGSLANALPLRIGRTSSGVTTGYLGGEFTAAAIWRRALTSGEIATLNSYFQGRA